MRLNQSTYSAEPLSASVCLWWGLLVIYIHHHLCTRSFRNNNNKMGLSSHNTIEHDVLSTMGFNLQNRLLLTDKNTIDDLCKAKSGKWNTTKRTWLNSLSSVQIVEATWSVFILYLGVRFPGCCSLLFFFLYIYLNLCIFSVQQ
jgi:hypothetical protein